MAFSNPIVGSSSALVRNAIKSRDFETGVSGWSINRDGTAEFNGVTTSGGNIALTDGMGNITASINGETGVGSFEDLFVVQSPTIAGRDFETEWMAERARGIISWGQSTASGTSTTSEIGLFEIQADLVVSRSYEIAAEAWIQSSVANDHATLRVRYTADGSEPTLSSAILAQQGMPLNQANIGEARHFRQPLIAPTSGTYRFLLCMVRLVGSGTMQLAGSASQPEWMTIEDKGFAVTNTFLTNTGAGGGGGGTGTFQKSYAANWSGSYNGSNNLSTFGGSQLCYQGNNLDSNGTRKSLIGFDWATIRSDLSGATINGCWVTLYFQHWYYNAGGTAVIGTHNLANTSSPPSTFFGANTARVQSSGWPKPGQRTVNLGATIGEEFRDSVSNGICLGSTGANNRDYYGYASGPGQPNPPVLIINYTV